MIIQSSKLHTKNNIGLTPPYWTKKPTNTTWKGTCTISRRPKNPKETETRKIDFTAEIDFKTHQVKGTGNLNLSNNPNINCTLNASYGMDGVLHGTFTIDTDNPVICNLNLDISEIREKGIAGAFDSLDINFKGDTDSAGNSYAGTFVAYSPDIDD